MDDQEWFRAVAAGKHGTGVDTLMGMLPGLPSEEIQLRTTGMSGEQTLREAFEFYLDCRRVSAQAGNPLTPASQVLDFGTGWGRVARFFLKDVELRNIYGVDVMPQFIDICRATFAIPDNFAVTDPFPPTSFSDESFTHVVGYSVFSHLSERACQAWAREFARLLVPGGLVGVTTRGRPFFDYCESLGSLPPDVASPYQTALSRMFADFDVARDEYDHGELVHAAAPGLSGGGTMTSEFYGETFIPPGYAETGFLPHLELVAFDDHPERQTHPIIFLRKPALAGRGDSGPSLQ